MSAFARFDAFARLREIEAGATPSETPAADPAPPRLAGGMPDAWAAALDAVSEAHPPAGILCSEWEARVRQVRRFAELCGVALDAREAEEPAWLAFSKATDAQRLSAPAYPADLLIKARVYERGGASPVEAPVREEDRRCSPEDDAGHGGLFERTVTRIATRDGTSRTATAARLKAEYWAYECARIANEARHELPAKQAAAEAASERATRAFAAVLEYEARTPQTLLTQLRLRAEEYEAPNPSEWGAIVSSLVSIFGEGAAAH